MTKKIIRVVIVLGILILVLLCGVYFAANSIIAKLKPELEKAISSALAADVRLGEIRTSILPDVSFTIDHSSIGPADKGLKVDNITLNVRLRPLLSKRLEITKLSIEKPSVALVRDLSGMRIEGLNALSSGTKQAHQESAPKAKTSTDAAPLPSGVSFSLDQFQIEHAHLSIDDQLAKRRIDLNDVDVSFKVAITDSEVTLTSLKVAGDVLGKIPFALAIPELKLALASKSMRSDSIEARLLDNAIQMAVVAALENKHASIKLGSKNGIELAKFQPLHTLLPQDTAASLEKLGLRGNIKPEIEITADPRNALPQVKGVLKLTGIEAQLPTIGMKDLNGDIALSPESQGLQVSSPKVEFKINAQPVDVNFKTLISEHFAADLQSLVLHMSSGEIRVRGRSDPLGTKNVGAEFSAAHVNIGEVVRTVAPQFDQWIDGTLFKADGNIAAQMGESLMSSLRGTGNINIVDGKLLGINLASEVLKKVTGLPFISGDLNSTVPQGQKAAVDDKDTVIKLLTLDYVIEGPSVRLKSLVLQSNLFRLEGEGTIGLDKSIDLNATIIFSGQFTAALVSVTRELSKILDAQSQLVLPLHISGTLPKVMVLPNLKKVVEIAGKKILQQKATDFLGNLLTGRH